MRETDRKRWSCLGSFQTRRLNVSAILFLTAIALSMSASAASVECRLSSEEGGRYGGKCVDRNEGEFALAVDLIALETSEKSLCGEAWPEGEWQGQMTIGEAAKVGVSVVCEWRGDQQTLYIKDPRGWFPLADVAIDSQSWSFHYDLQGRVKTDETDTKILRRAEELLSDPSKWNREDDRQCEDDSQTQKRSLYCALHQASIDITGKYEHRRPGLQEVRFAIDEVAGEGVFDHRLRDFNNSRPFAEIQEVLRMALKSVDTCRGPGI